MLVLTRHANAGDASIIKIGHDIEIIITEIRGDQVRIGIHAPRDIAIHRREVYDELTAESQAGVVRSLEVQSLEAQSLEIR